MMTKNILISGGPLAAAEQDSKPKVQSAKPGREFAAVMEQAVGPSAKPGRDFAAVSKQAHARSMRAAARGRGEEGAAKAERVAKPGSSERAGESRGSTLTEKDLKFKVQSSKPEQPEFAAVEDQKPRAAMASESLKRVKPDGSAEEGEVSREVALAAEEDVKEELPSNIMVFPGVAAAVSNIIPFPLVAAPVGTEAQGAKTEVQSAVLSVEGSKPESDPVLAPVQSSKSGTQSSTFNVEGSKPEDVQGGGMKVIALGLKPVTGRESAELSQSVPLMPLSATVATPNEADAVSTSSNVIEVAFRTATVERAVPVAGAVSESAAGTQTQLPGETAKLAESAPSFSSLESSANIVLLRTDAAKTAAGVGLPAPVPLGAGRVEAAGIGDAKQEVGMESTMTSEREKVAAESSDTALEALPQPATSSSERDGFPTDFSSRTLMATEWQTGRTDGVVERSGSDSEDAKAIDGTGTVERIASLMVRESTLVKQHGSDSMAVVLRPDAETELFVHLSLRDGQIEATVRCERGDVQHLGALWSQLQESLVQHKVRLAPLQDAPPGQSNFNQSPGSGMSSGQNGTRKETRPEKQFMDERSASAASQSTAPHVRGTGGSRSRRITTSRPGWETWA